MTPADPISGLLILALSIVTFGYIATCAFWPFKACRYCGGTGKLRSPIIRAIRLCPRCPNASGLRLRTGRKAWNAFRRLGHTKPRNR